MAAGKSLATERTALFSLEAGVAARVAIFAMAPSILWESLPGIGSAVRGLTVEDLGPALVLAVLFAGFLEPLRDLLIGPGHHGGHTRLGSFVLTVLMSTPLVLIHTPLHDYLHHDTGTPLMLVLGQGLIALGLAFAWMAQTPRFRWPLGVIAALMPVLAGYGLGWSAGDIWYTCAVCAVIFAWAGPGFRPWTRRSMELAAGAVLVAGGCYLVLMLTLHMISQHLVALPHWLLNEGGPGEGSWTGIWIEDALFYGGWALGLFAHQGLSLIHI